MDQKGASVPGAIVELRNAATNDARTQTTGDTGSYTFASVPPGDYKITIKKDGFRTTIVGPLNAQVGKSLTVDATLEIGTVAQTVEVQAGAQVELQTLDAAVGNVLDRKTLDNIPSLSRDATALLLLQPLANPGFNSPGSPNLTGEGDNTGGQVAGARSDQNTFLLDGGDATDSTAGSGQYSGTNFGATPRAVVPTPVESLEEFRVITNNASAGFSRSAGGEVQMVTRRGGNTYHGAVYEYLQNNKLNANTWTRNNTIDPKTGLTEPNPALRDNRYGGRFGGPIWKDKTFFFVHYEGRHFVSSSDIVRRVPSADMRAGILHFGGGLINLNNVPTVAPSTGAVVPVTQCNFPGGGTGPCDPRNIGLDPAIKAVWNRLPTGNQLFGSGADGINTVAFAAPTSTPLTEQFGVIRLDQNINSKWQAFASYRYGKTTFSAPVQVDIGGLLPGDTSGQPATLAQRPLAPRYLVLGLTGQITPHLTTQTSYDWLRHWWQWATFTPSGMPSPAGFTQPDGLQGALTIGGEGITVGMQPINVDTQNARSRLWNGKDNTIIENLTWVKGKHIFEFGGRYGHQNFFHQRDDKVVGGLTSLVMTVGRNSSSSGISGLPTPVAGLLSGETSRWNMDYAEVLGMVDRAQQLFTRQPDFSPNAAGVPLLQHTIVQNYSLYATDSWKLTPSLTVSLGLNWGTQLPPYEQTGEQTMMVDDSTGKPISFDQYINTRRTMALAGEIFNPQLDFVPIKKLGRKYPYDPDWTNFSPRAAVAWNPSFTSGLLGDLLGNRKSVIRTGYARVYDRINGVGIVMIPALGVGFGNNIQCKGPTHTAAGPVCTGTGGANPTTAFRIGTDPGVAGKPGALPIPSLAPISGDALIPGVNSPFETLDFRIDPKRKVGYADTVNLTFQRELPHNMFIEVGYVANYAKRLYQGFALSQVPYMYTLGGQSFAQAFSNIATTMRTKGTSAAVIAAIPNQPFLEALGAATKTACGASCTQFFIKTFGDGNGGFVNANVTDFWEGLPIPNASGCGGADTCQIVDSYAIGSHGHSNYNAGFVTLRKTTAIGLNFNFNYTLAHAFDQIGQNQESLNESTDAFNLNRDYGSAQFDRRHTFTTLATYDLPFGRGHLATSNWTNKLIGGWNVSGVWTYGSGLPIDVYNSNSCQEYGNGPVFGNCAGLLSISGKRYNASPQNGSTSAFADPAAVQADFRVPDLVTDGRTGRGFIRGYGRWNMDFGISKTTKITERVSTRFDCQMTNAFNHPLLAGTGGFYSGDMAVDFGGASSAFGAINTQYNSPRFVQFGLRFDF